MYTRTGWYTLEQSDAITDTTPSCYTLEQSEWQYNTWYTLEQFD